MTRNWGYLLQESKGLLVAICISLFLHLFLLGQSHFVLPKLDNERSMIEARLVTPEPVAVQTMPNKVKEVNKPSLPKEVPLIKPQPEETIQEATKAEPEKIAATPLPDLAAAPAIEQQDVVDDIPQGDAGLIVNQHPYKYVETEFDVRTDIDAKVKSDPAGKAIIIYKVVKNGEGYELNSLIQAIGLAALVIPDLQQTSKGYLTDKGLRPTRYLYQFGDKKDKTYQADFDWETNKLTMHTSKGDKQTALVEGAQDLLSFMYQFMFVAPLQDMQLAITNGKKLDIYDYTFEGEEVINTKMGDIKTIHLLRASGDDEKDELWLALDYQYVPVKIRKTEKENKVYELLITSLKTEKPPI
ncbi:MAG: DUF3108 domain-containing protein [Methylotenera sp.]|nr:DUF3108 domain-containing protein [Methylotenera sp.]